MIIARTPFRISFAGGGSDLPDFYKKHGGAVVSTSIDKYIHVSLLPHFEKNTLLLKYTETEKVERPHDLKNHIARTILTHQKMRGLEIASSGDLPSQTGLGSSSSFAVSLYHALSAHQNKKVSPEELAKYACETEIKKLKYPIGKQDQYAAAYGGLNFIRFEKDGTVSVEPIRISAKKKNELDENLLLFYTGITRSANDILEVQKNNIQKKTSAVGDLKKMVAIAYEMRDALERDHIKEFGQLLHKGWLLKRSVASTITNSEINRYYELGLKNGALGGKLLGAGGGGCLLFYCEKKNQKQLIKALQKLRHIPFSFSDRGSEIIFRQ
ncbi:MAG: GHMP kinase [Candidatus Pacebacteria bacterium]|jgi:D-glycero-alpha-D-manno-heptose-7-phosphate kinase|nr:GHMP kinase [Candidatus Paceibacterota bacterium]